MKEKLLSTYFTEYISSIIWDSDNLIPDNNFEYIETLEELCLSEFVVFKQIFDQLELIDKNEVIKYWNIHYESKFDEYLRFCPGNYNNFDREEFFGDDYSSYIGGTKVFHLRHYVEKFNFLIRSFLLCEEEYLKKRILDPNAQKEVFNPLLVLNFDDINVTVSINNLSEDLNSLRERIIQVENKAIPELPMEFVFEKLKCLTYDIPNLKEQYLSHQDFETFIRIGFGLEPLPKVKANIPRGHIGLFIKVFHNLFDKSCREYSILSRLEPFCSIIERSFSNFSREQIWQNMRS
jgi:hypothetical protein